MLDAGGTELHRARPQVDGDRVRLTVPDAVLDGAAYPLTIDPVLSPRAPGRQRTEDRIGLSPRSPATAAATSPSGWSGSRAPTPARSGGAGSTPAAWPSTRTGTTSPVPRWGAAGGTSPGVYVVVSAGSEFAFTVSPARAVGALALPDREPPCHRLQRVGPPGGVGGGRRHRGRPPRRGRERVDPDHPLDAAGRRRCRRWPAGGGGGFLVAWGDRRNSAQPDIFGTRVSATGTVVNPAGVALAVATGNQDAPALAFGSNYLLTWHDGRDWHVRHPGTRATTGGTVLDPTPLTISTRPNNQSFPAVAFDGTRFYVT